jgi:hypothetical protein
MKYDRTLGRGSAPTPREIWQNFCNEVERRCAEIACLSGHKLAAGLTRETTPSA